MLISQSYFEILDRNLELPVCSVIYSKFIFFLILHVLQDQLYQKFNMLCNE